ncbi:DUF190 domain-containing protein [Thermocrinis sp.]
MPAKEQSYVLARIFLREDEELNGEPLYFKLLELLRERNIAGATVLKAILGYGTTGEYHYEGIEVLSYNLPVVIEFVDEERNVNNILEELGMYIKRGLVSIEKAQVWEHSSQ